MLPRPLVIALAILISIMWAANLVVGFLYPGRSDPALNAIFAIVVGATFALGRRTENGPARSVRSKLAKLLDSEPKTNEDESDDRGGQS
ncbi:MAG: hypothetical protein WBA97_34615 [Actinophytocola sp.]|uniref:hypothetical protein n=1 Tax=Actinophytocola sp. TaxID=1872138 RepID=UPI003C7296A6